MEPGPCRDMPIPRQIALMVENIGLDDPNFPVEFVRSEGVPEDWTYCKARPQPVGGKDDEVCEVWHAGHGCRDWLKCENGTHPR